MKKCDAEEDAFLVIHAAEVGARDLVEADLVAVIGMGAPADVVQQAGGLDEPGVGGVARLEERQDEVIKPPPEAGHPGVLGLGEAAGFHQRVAVAQALRHLFVEHAFADAVA